jgi:hypothetical protein
MSEFIDMLKERLDDAQKRLLETQSHLQQAQLKHQAVTQEFTSLQTLLGLEIARAQRLAQETAVRAHPVKVAVPITATQAVPVALSGTIVTPEINKTEIIREALRQHTNGITPAQVWLNVKDHVGRNYVYSVLKRMKDKEEVRERRGKYYLQVGSQKEVGGNG